jgi:D-3-phosphoglycerate dehydrogenase
MKVLVADNFEDAGLAGLRGLGCEVVYEPRAGLEGLEASIARHAPDVLIVRSSKVSRAALEGSRVRLIIRAGAGVDNIDVPAASAKGTAVANCPGMNAVAVAELTMAHLLCCDRRLCDQSTEIRAGRWNKKEFAKGRGLKGSTLGIVGLGAIGQAVAKRALAFEMNVIGWEAVLDASRVCAVGVQWGGSDRAALLAMLPQCDAVTVHVAGVPETRGLCDAAFFAAMKPGAYFVNTSRGSVVDEAALRDAIKTRGLRAGLDVYENQPAVSHADFVNETVQLPGVTGTHHCGASTDQAQQAVAAEVVRMVGVYARTGRFENCVNAGDLEGRVDTVR